MDKIDGYRKEIDAIDAQLMTLLDERFTLSDKIGRAKAQCDSPVHDPNREAKVLDKASAYQHEASIRALYKELMTLSKKLQRKG